MIKRFVVVLAALVVASFIGSGIALAGNNDNYGNKNDRQAICHATGSEKNPYVQITPDKNGDVYGHAGASHQDGRDIIPPFQYNDHGQLKSFPGQNWDGEHQAVFYNGCKPVTPPPAPGTIVLWKVLKPSNDPGKFDLRVNEQVVAAAVGDGGHGSVQLPAGNYTVNEVGVQGTDLSNYTSSVDCVSDMAKPVDPPGTSLAVTLHSGETLTCTFTNVRKATPPPPPLAPKCVLSAVNADDMTKLITNGSAVLVGTNVWIGVNVSGGPVSSFQWWLDDGVQGNVLQSVAVDHWDYRVWTNRTFRFTVKVSGPGGNGECSFVVTGFNPLPPVIINQPGPTVYVDRTVEKAVPGPTQYSCVDSDGVVRTTTDPKAILTLCPPPAPRSVTKTVKVKERQTFCTDSKGKTHRVFSKDGVRKACPAPKPAKAIVRVKKVTKTVTKKQFLCITATGKAKQVKSKAECVQPKPKKKALPHTL